MIATLTLGDWIRTITWYDAGGGLILLVLYGVPLGILFDYVWNRLVLRSTLRGIFRGSSGPAREMALKRIALYCLYITVLGLVIDWVYYKLIWWAGGLQGANIWIPDMSPAGQWAWILMPMAVLWVGNFVLSKGYLMLDARQASVTSSVMAFFTAPWLVVAVPYIANWA